MSPYECMICGSREHVLREGPLCLCTRCLAALGQALGEKLPCMAAHLNGSDCAFSEGTPTKSPTDR